MILTTCAACAAPLAYDANHCARCETRYCSDACFHAKALFLDTDATLDDLREAVATIEDTVRIARRVLGGAHPTTTGIVEDLLRAREVSNK